MICGLHFCRNVPMMGPPNFACPSVRPRGGTLAVAPLGRSSATECTCERRSHSGPPMLYGKHQQHLGVLQDILANSLLTHSQKSHRNQAEAGSFTSGLWTSNCSNTLLMLDSKHPNQCVPALRSTEVFRSEALRLLRRRQAKPFGNALARRLGSHHSPASPGSVRGWLSIMDRSNTGSSRFFHQRGGLRLRAADFPTHPQRLLEVVA